MSDKRKAAIEAMVLALANADCDQIDAPRLESTGDFRHDYDLKHYAIRATAALDALLAALPALGLRVVPVEMTRDMMLAAMDRSPDGDTLYHGIHQASCAAAPNVLGGSDGE